ncbi:hypothetical protein CRUP_022876 [Coryphaenoides rupestris]|nr:hypothetical protein CRUP_022876 [Coryphaenoides rupestris]
MKSAICGAVGPGHVTRSQPIPGELESVAGGGGGGGGGGGDERKVQEQDKRGKVSMKEAGDGLHAQMNSMMGALQELKLLQVQTALESLDISGRPINRGPPPQPAPAPTSVTAAPAPAPPPPAPPAPAVRTPLHEDPRIPCQNQTSPEVELSSPWPSVSPVQSPRPSLGSSRVGSSRVGSAGQRGAPGSRPQHRSSDSMDDSSDWTSSLMSQRRNRQPLVLGDNVFADLVGNWLDLPELERGEGEAEEQAEAGEEDRRKRRGEGIADRWLDRPDSPAHPLHPSKSQEISRKFSLTTNIFKKFLRSVRPDRDKLLKERPGWVAPEHAEGDLFKRPKKAAPKSAKGSFYLPFWAAGQQQQQGKGRPCGPQVNVADGRSERTHPLFDHNTAGIDEREH